MILMRGALLTFGVMTLLLMGVLSMARAEEGTFAFATYAASSPQGMNIHRIWMGNKTVRQTDQLTHSELTGFSNYSPMWSPNGNEIAYLSTNGRTYQLIIMNADGHQRRIINDDIWFNTVLVSWSPDGEYLLLVSNHEYNYEIYRVPRMGGALQNLTNSPYLEFEPSWSPDGQWIAFIGAPDNITNVFIMRQDGSDLRQLTHDSAQKSRLNWSPDSASLLYTGHEGSQRQIFQVSLQDERIEEVTAGNLPAVHSMWSPDGSRLFFTTMTRQIFIMHADGTDRMYYGNDFYDTTTQSWSPDGVWLIYESRGLLQRLEVASPDPLHASERLLPEVQRACCASWSPTMSLTWQPLIMGVVGILLMGVAANRMI